MEGMWWPTIGERELIIEQKTRTEQKFQEQIIINLLSITQ
jgi:hypothetical protein